MANPKGVNQHSNGAGSNRHQVHVTNRTASTPTNKELVQPPAPKQVVKQDA